MASKNNAPRFEECWQQCHLKFLSLCRSACFSHWLTMQVYCVVIVLLSDPKRSLPSHDPRTPSFFVQDAISMTGDFTARNLQPLSVWWQRSQFTGPSLRCLLNATSRFTERSLPVWHQAKKKFSFPLCLSIALFVLVF